jgi:hypothetical protein
MGIRELLQVCLLLVISVIQHIQVVGTE